MMSLNTKPALTKKSIFLIGILSLIILVSAIQITTFTNSLTEENLTFSGDENISRNLTIYRYANITSAFMNLSGILIDTKTHETFGGEGSFYNIDDNPTRAGILFNLTGVKIDFFGSWIPYGTATPGNLSIVYRNISDDSIIYSKNMGLVVDIVSDNLAYNEYDISDSPLITEPIYILFERTDTSDFIRFYTDTSGGSSPQGEIFDYFTPVTYNATDYTLRTSGDSPMNITFEEGYGYSTNPYIKLNNTNIWSLSDSTLNGTTTNLNKLNDSSTSINITFTGNENQTKYLKILKHANITSATLNLSGFVGGDCYQESANISNQTGTDGNCNLDYNGGYNVYDSYLYINYSKPIRASSSKWKIKHGDDDEYNISILSTCFNMNEIRLRIFSNVTGSYNTISYGECWNGTWNLITTNLTASNGATEGAQSGDYSSNMFDGDWDTHSGWSGSYSPFGLNWYTYPTNYPDVNWTSRIYEEAMYWNFYPTNTSIKINNTDIWNYTGEFNSTVSPNQTNDFSSTLNTYLSGCSANSENYCDVPLLYHSDTAGILQTDNIDIDYNNISKTLNFFSTLNTALSSGSCDGGILSGVNCIIEFIFHSDTSGILEYSNIDINYDPNPLTTLISPEDNDNSPAENTFSCNVSTDVLADLTNITLWIWNSTGIFNNTETKLISGTTNSTEVNITFPSTDTYIWNCLAYNNKSISDWGINRTLYVDIDDPAVNINYPDHNQWSTNSLIYFNYTPSHSTQTVDTCELWGNFTGSWALNQSDYSITEDVINQFNLTLLDTSYLFNVKCNTTETGNSAFHIINHTFFIDTISPVMNNMTIITTTDSTQFNFTSNITDDNLDSCKYSVWTGSTPGTNTSFTCNIETIANAPGFGIFSLYLYATDVAGNQNSQNLAFTTSISEKGGGGGTTTIIIGGEEGQWTMESRTGFSRFDIGMPLGTRRDLFIILKNTGSESRDIKLSCEDISGSVCKYVSFPENPVILPNVKDQETRPPFIITIPKDAELGNFVFNIVGTDDSNRVRKVSVFIEIKESGFFAKLFSRTQGGFPYMIIFLGSWIISLLASMWILGILKAPLRPLISFIVSTTIASVGVIIF